MGVSTGWGGGGRLAGIVGRGAALRMLAWSLPVTATEGLALGLVDAVGPEEGGARAAAEEFLREVLERDAFGAFLHWRCGIGIFLRRSGLIYCCVRRYSQSVQYNP